MSVEYDAARSIGMGEARLLIQGRRGPVSVEVCRRWANGGVSVGGTVVVLRAVKLSGVLRTMPEWVADFEKARAAAGMRGGAVAKGRTPRQRAAAHARAEAELERCGCA